MADLPAYERDPYRVELDAELLGVGREGKRTYAVLRDTILYPEGGGQPPDHGLLGEVPIVDAQKRDGELRHYVDAAQSHAAEALTPGPVRVRLDWPRRFDHMQQHTGQHLLSAVAEDRFGWVTTAFHMGPFDEDGRAVSDVELGVASPSAGDLDRLEEAVASEIRAARPVTIRRVSVEDLAALPVRTRGLPEGHVGDVRLVEIGGVDLNTCGGTHLRSTAEIEVLKLLATEAIRGGTRLFFVAGGRARRRFARHEARGAALRALLGAPDDELAATARAKLEQLHAAERRLRSLDEELALSAADSLAAREERSGRIFQGKAGSLAERERALATLRERGGMR